MSLPELRARIEAVDDALVDLLADRAALVAEVWALKADQGRPRHDPAREEAETSRLVARGLARGLDPDALRAVLAQVIGRGLRSPPDASR